MQTRLGASARGWVRMDGLPFKDVFSNGAQDPVLNTVRYTEHGEAVGSSVRVMSGLPFSGAAYNCRNFTSTSSADTIASGLVEGGPGRWVLNAEGGTYHLCSDGSVPRHLSRQDQNRGDFGDAGHRQASLDQHRHLPASGGPHA